MCRRYAELIFALALCALAACGSAPPDTTPAKADKGEAVDPAAAPVEEPIPPEAVQRFDQAVVHMTAGDSAAAEREFRALADAYPTYSGPLLNLGIIHAKSGRLEDAQKEINAAIERNANNAPAFNQLGIIYRKLGRFKDADAAYQRALQIDPNYAIAYLNLGVLCDLYLQEPQRALEAYERYLSLASAPDQKVNGWVTELKKRLGAGEPRAARAQ
jgi:Flp pilus assembly protein TadD